MKDKAAEAEKTKSVKTKEKEAVSAAKKKKKVQVAKVKVFVTSTYNNTIVSVADYAGNVLSWSSSGTVGFSGSKKSTAYAASRAAEDAIEKAKKYGVREAVVIIKGAGMGRQAAVKGLRTSGIRITTLSDFTPVPHGGTTPRKLPKK